MEIFKTGIIMKEKCVIGKGVNEKYQELIENNGVDAYANDFVKVKLVPYADEWWENPCYWELYVEQRNVPIWYEKNVDKYNKMFIDKVIGWWMLHVYVDKEYEDVLKDGFYLLKNSKVGCLLGKTNVILDNSKVCIACDKGVIENMYNGSFVEQLGGNCEIWNMDDSSTAYDIFGHEVKSGGKAFGF